MANKTKASKGFTVATLVITHTKGVYRADYKTIDGARFAGEAMCVPFAIEIRTVSQAEYARTPAY